MAPCGGHDVVPLVSSSTKTKARCELIRILDFVTQPSIELLYETFLNQTHVSTGLAIQAKLEIFCETHSL